jgi:hypothetical protein
LASCRAVLPALMLSHATDFITLVSPVSFSTAVAVQPCPPLQSYAQSQLTSPVCIERTAAKQCGNGCPYRASSFRSVKSSIDIH